MGALLMLALTLGTYSVDVIEVVDGDTILARVHIWIGLKQITKLRIRGIDAPEMRAKRECERRAARLAKRIVEDLILLDPGGVTISNIESGKYSGRIITDVSVNGIDVADFLLSQNLAVPYEGGKRQPWECNDE